MSGKAVEWTDKQIEDLSIPRKSEIDAAVAWWRKVAPPNLRKLLDGPAGEHEVDDGQDS